MAEINRPIIIGDIYTNIIDSYTGESINYKQTSVWKDGSIMDDTKCDGVIYRKQDNKYFVDVNFYINKEININRFGILGEDPTINTKIFNKAITILNNIVNIYGKGLLKPSPLPNYMIGTSYNLIIPSGTYKINNVINYSYFTNIIGNNSIIYQIDSTKDIFYSESPFENLFKGLIFIGGKNQIVAQNGVTNVAGLEGVITKIEDCIFQSNSEFAIKINRSGAGGGHQFIISNSKWFEGKKFLYASCDKGSVKGSWLETSSFTQDDNTAWIDNRTSLMLEDIVFVPGGDYITKLNRYVDNYDSVDFNNCRMGGEGGGGLPFVYNFTDALASNIHPYQSGGTISIRNCPNASCGNTAKPDASFIVIKQGLPKSIIIENNNYSADPPYIKTGLFNNSNFVDFPTYFNRSVSGKHINIVIQHNNKWASYNLLDNNSDILMPFIKFTKTDITGNTDIINRLSAKYISSDKIIAGSSDFGIIPTKSVSDNILILDSNIFKTTANVGWTNGGVYSFAIKLNTNGNSSNFYRNAFYGILGVFIYYNGGAQVYGLVYKPILNEAMAPWDAGLTVTPVFWDGTTESSTLNLVTDAQIRLKIASINGTDLGMIVSLINKIV